MKEVTSRTIVWFRQDLRTVDHPTLTAACAKGDVIPVYIWSPEDEAEWPLGAASKWWLHHSLLALSNDLRELGLSLVIRKGKTAEVLKNLVQETGAKAVYWSRRYEPAAVSLTASIMAHLQKQGIECQSFNASLLHEPWTIANKQGKPYQVFTPFWKTCLAAQAPEMPLEKPRSLSNQINVDSETIDSLQLLPKIPWDSGIKAYWKPGTAEALKKLNHFASKPILSYSEMRDIPGVEGVSHLSPYLHFGEISSRMIWHHVIKCHQDKGECYLRQLGWREFAHYLLYHFSETPKKPLRQEFNRFPWDNNALFLSAWQKGMTGYPIVDAGMRQLWKTGWMHNRVRMVVGSFLVKDLLLSWQEGAAWFWDTLVDADLANNTMGWQWIGGCGADAAPYFRIFNPITQGEKFDSNGVYIREWVPDHA